MAMEKFLTQVKRKLQQQNWAEDEDIYAFWDEQPKSSEQKLIEAVTTSLGTVIDAIVKAKADNSTADWKEEVADIIPRLEKEHGSSHVKIVGTVLRLSTAASIDAFIEDDLTEAGLDGLGIAIKQALDSVAEDSIAPQEESIASESDNAGAGDATSEETNAND